MKKKLEKNDEKVMYDDAILLYNNLDCSSKCFSVLSFNEVYNIVWIALLYKSTL